jgi:hypothetical protein
VAASGEQQFTATVTGATDTSVTWSVDEVAGGSVDTNGLYTAPSGTGTFHVRATSNADDTKFAEATVTVTLASSIVVFVAPSEVSVATSNQQQFTATVTGAADTSVTWSVDEGSTGGSVDTTGLYAAPGTQGTFHVRATSNADNTKFAEATVTVASLSVSVVPAAETVQVGTNQQFVARVTGTSNTNVGWSVDEGSAGGSVGISGLYSAPSSAGTFHVRATSLADGQSAVATVFVTTDAPAVAVTVSPNEEPVQTGAQLQFTATVAGATNTSVTWSVDENACGTVSASGLYTAPGNISPQSSITCQVRATSVADTTASGFVFVDVLTL